MLDESFLDTPDALARADARGLLLAAAESGARVRNAARAAAEAGIGTLRPDGRPRSLLLAGPGPSTYCAADVLDALLSGSVQIRPVSPTGADADPATLRWALPGWAGPLDLLVVATGWGREPGLEALVEQAYRRGMSVVAVAPRDSPVTETVGTTHGMTLPMIPLPAVEEPGSEPEAPGTLWALLTPLLALTDRLGLLSAPAKALDELADRLDSVAERCGPAIETYTNPAKTLAAELSDSLPLLWSTGPLSTATGRHLAATLAAVAGRPALAAPLPHALQAHGPLLAGQQAEDPEDFFRDRVEEPEPLLPRVVLMHDGEPAGASPAPAARALAHGRGTPISELEPAEGTPLQIAAELIALADFTAVYLALASSDR
ncbi:SIS domain-containing protein [Streptomyces sp. NPDC051940]|uniref:SIS domain-containing protein n=1 Tax=Streptomyces sp. NPDC051940 TaxID=3155675 RepID=UPI003433F7A0